MNLIKALKYMKIKLLIISYSKKAFKFFKSSTNCWNKANIILNNYIIFYNFHNKY